MKITEHPILYSTPMIQAKLERRKTQTRRTRNLNEINESPDEFEFMGFVKRAGDDDHIYAYFRDGGEDRMIQFPYGKVGDVLWSREAWCFSANYHDCGMGCEYGCQAPVFYYRADVHDADGIKWKPSIHQPKRASRIWERITHIRVERLQDISEEDAIAEGIEFRPHSELPELTVYRDYSVSERDRFAYGKGWGAKESYQTLWESINGEDSWNLNPWVWAITTEVLSTTGRPKELSDELILNTPER